MPEYSYQALDKHGRQIKGTIGATSEEAVVKELRAMGYFPIEVSGTRMVEQERTISRSPRASETSHRLMKPEPAWITALSALLGKGRESSAVQQCLGVELEGSSLKLAEMNIEETGLRIGRILEARAPIEGRKIQGRALVTAMRSLIKQHKITSKKSVCCVPAESVFIQRLRLPIVSEPRLSRIILYEANQRIPCPPKNIIVYEILNTDGEKEFDILVVGLKEEIYSQYIRIVRRIGLRPVGISFCSLTESSVQDLRPLILKRKLSAIRFLLLPSQ
jgi:hypothetical protein